MILYFTGTGNSEYIAKRLADLTGDSLISINKRIRENDISEINANGRLVFVVPTYCWRIPRVVEEWIDKIGVIIGKEKPFTDDRKSNIIDFLKSSVINTIFYSFLVKADKFTADDKCVGCGICVKECSLNNINLKGNKPIWEKECTHCMACICKCPKEAIDYGEKSIGKI